MKDLKSIKFIMMAVVAAVFFPQVADWCEPGVGLHQAACWLGLNGDTRCFFPLWGYCVRQIGKDPGTLAFLSLGAALCHVALIATIIGDLFTIALRKTIAKGGRRTPPFVKGLTVVLAVAAFVLTPGLTLSAVRISPLMVALLPPALALALLVHEFAGEKKTWLERLKHSGFLVFLVLVLLVYSVVELVPARRVFFDMAFPALPVFLLLGVMPALASAWLVHLKRMDSPRMRGGFFAVWILAVFSLGAYTFSSGVLHRGRAANRIATQLIAEVGERAAILCDGSLDDVFLFMLPDDKRLVSLARVRDPAYGRELADWVRDAAGTNRIDDLVFAAELGPKALVDEWVKIDLDGLEKTVLTLPNYFPTRKKWFAACEEVENIAWADESERYLRRLLGVCGNYLGCRLIEAGKLQRAWEVFDRVAGTVDRGNYAALVNQSGMLQRGYKATSGDLDALKKRLAEFDKRLDSQSKVVAALKAGGRVYVAPDYLREYEEERLRRANELVELTPEAKAFIASVAAAPKGRAEGEAARESIIKAVNDGMVNLDRIGGELLTIDMALGDSDNAEKDAIEVLRANRHDPTANAVIGTFCSERGDYARAERYLRRAIESGHASIAAKNNFAVALLKTGRAKEAEPYVREAMKDLPGIWQIHETLTAVLIAEGRLDEAEKALAETEALAEKAGYGKHAAVDVEIDRVALAKARNDEQTMKYTLRMLRARKDLTDEQQKAIAALVDEDDDE